MFLKVVDDRGTVCLFIFRLLAMPQVNLKYDLVRAYHERGALSRANRPKIYALFVEHLILHETRGTVHIASVVLALPFTPINS